MNTRRIILNGKAYSDPAEVPPDLREQYDRLMGLFEDGDGNGVPDIMESRGPFQVRTRIVKKLSELNDEERSIVERARREAGVPSTFDAPVVIETQSAASFGVLGPEGVLKDHGVRSFLGRMFFFVLLALLVVFIARAWPR